MTKAEMLMLARQRMAAGGHTWVPVRDAAAICDVKTSTLRMWIREGLLKTQGNPLTLDLGQVLTVRAGSCLHPPGSPLSYREIRLVRLMALGHTNAEIAELTGHTLGGATAGVKAVLRKLGARTRAHAVYIGCVQGFVTEQANP